MRGSANPGGGDWMPDPRPEPTRRVVAAGRISLEQGEVLVARAEVLHGDIAVHAQAAVVMSDPERVSKAVRAHLLERVIAAAHS